MTAKSGDERESKPRSAPTVLDVAARAGVSPMTVSRVLSGGTNVRGHMRARVERAVEELGYHRNENARSIRPGHHSGLVGVMITNLSNPYYAEMLLGIEEVLSRSGRRILVGNTNEDEKLESKLIADFVGRQVEGLIAVPTGQDPSRWTPVRLGRAPLVLASRAVPGSEADTVLISDVSGAFQATMSLLAEGHRRIAFLGNRVSVFTGQRRYDGYRQAHEEYGLEPVDELVRQGQQDVHSAERAMAELLGLVDPPTAVFAANNRNTVGAIRAIRARELKSDKDSRRSSALPPIRLFGFDPFEFADMSPVPLSIVDHDARELGRQAAGMLIERLDSGMSQPLARLLELPISLRDMF